MNILSANRTTANDQPISSSRSRRLLFPVAWLISVAGLVWLGIDIAGLRSWLKSVGPGAPVAFVLVSIALMSVVLPKTAVSISAGLLFGTTLGTALMVVIAAAAASLNYAIGSWWLRDSIHQMLQKREQQTDSDQLTWMHAVAGLAADAGFGLHLLIRVSPIPTMVISYFMGALGSRRGPYLLAAVVAVVPQILWIHAGSSATMIGNPDTSSLRSISAGLSLAVAILIAVVLPRAAMKRLKERRHQRSPCDEHLTARDRV